MYIYIIIPMMSSSLLLTMLYSSFPFLSRICWIICDFMDSDTCLSLVNEAYIILVFFSLRFGNWSTPFFLGDIAWEMFIHPFCCTSSIWEAPGTDLMMLLSFFSHPVAIPLMLCIFWVLVSHPPPLLVRFWIWNGTYDTCYMLQTVFFFLT